MPVGFPLPAFSSNKFNLERNALGCLLLVICRSSSSFFYIFLFYIYILSYLCTIYSKGTYSIIYVYIYFSCFYRLSYIIYFLSVGLPFYSTLSSCEHSSASREPLFFLLLFERTYYLLLCHCAVAFPKSVYKVISH